MLTDQIDADFKQAMKDRNQVKTATLSFLRSQLKYAAIDKKTDKLADADVSVVIKKQIKQRQDSIEQYEKGGRPELAEKEKQELEILKAYLPEEMSGADLEKVVADIIKATGAQGMKDMGKVMKEVSAQVAGKADNKAVSEVVKKLLSHQ